MTRLLVIEDDESYVNALSLVLNNNGFEVITARTGAEGLKMAYNHTPGLVILDLIMPDMNGVEICRRLKTVSSTPVIILTGLSDETSMVQGLDAGADDFLTKPCPTRILVAKIQAILRRTQTQQHKTPRSRFSDGFLDLELTTGEILVDGEDAKLTSTEHRLLSYLVRNADRVVPHDELIEQVWGEEANTDKRSLKLYVLYLRRKIEKDPDNPIYLQTAWGVGYRFHLPLTA